METQLNRWLAAVEFAGDELCEEVSRRADTVETPEDAATLAILDIVLCRLADARETLRLVRSALRMSADDREKLLTEKIAGNITQNEDIRATALTTLAEQIRPGSFSTRLVFGATK